MDKEALAHLRAHNNTIKWNRATKKAPTGTRVPDEFADFYERCGHTLAKCVACGSLYVDSKSLRLYCKPCELEIVSKNARKESDKKHLLTSEIIKMTPGGFERALKGVLSGDIILEG